VCQGAEGDEEKRGLRNRRNMSETIRRHIHRKAAHGMNEEIEKKSKNKREGEEKISRVTQILLQSEGGTWRGKGQRAVASDGTAGEGGIKIKKK